MITIASIISVAAILVIVGATFRAPPTAEILLTTHRRRRQSRFPYRTTGRRE